MNNDFVMNMLIKLEDRVTKIENFINSINFNKGCEHKFTLKSKDITCGSTIMKCHKCGEIK